MSHLSPRVLSIIRIRLRATCLALLARDTLVIDIVVGDALRVVQATAPAIREHLGDRARPAAVDEQLALVRLGAACAASTELLRVRSLQLHAAAAHVVVRAGLLEDVLRLREVFDLDRLQVGASAGVRQGGDVVRLVKCGEVR